jgi:hypothetical protein
VPLKTAPSGRRDQMPVGPLNSVPNLKSPAGSWVTHSPSCARKPMVLSAQSEPSDSVRPTQSPSFTLSPSLSVHWSL